MQRPRKLVRLGSVSLMFDRSLRTKAALCLATTVGLLVAGSCQAGSDPQKGDTPKPPPIAWSEPLYGRPLRPNRAAGCGSILFLGYREVPNNTVDIALLDAKPPRVTAITTFTTTDFSSAAWSPAAHFVAFTGKARRSGLREELFVVRADGSGRRRLTRGLNVDFALSWSPDETQIAVRDLGSDSIVAVDLDGRHRVLGAARTPCGPPPGSGSCIRYAMADERRWFS